MKRAAIALGGNLGDSATILGQALGELERVKGIKLEAHSQWYQTAAVGTSSARLSQRLRHCASGFIALRFTA
jgi:7,8-dihydro-6-hydroxymethylpterin-pyrophosphokinase